MSGSWRVETTHEASAERFATEGAAIARAWEVTPPGSTRPGVFFDYLSAAPTQVLERVAIAYSEPILHIGKLPKPEFARVGEMYNVSGGLTAYVCVAKDNARFCTWEKVKLMAPGLVETTELLRLQPWLVRPVDDTDDND